MRFLATLMGPSWWVLQEHAMVMIRGYVFRVPDVLRLQHASQSFLGTWHLAVGAWEPEYLTQIFLAPDICSSSNDNSAFS